MNKQLEKFAEQAGEYYRTTKPGAYAYPTPVVGAAIPPEVLEKFAELIIRECMSVAKSQRDPHTLNYKPSERFVEELKQHFGVK